MKLLSLAVIGLTLDALAAAPNLARVSPAAVPPGRNTAITFFGEHLEGAVELWTSFPCKAAAEDSQPAAFALEIPSQPRASLGAIRLVTTNGLSNLHLILIDPLPTVDSVRTNQSRASAQPLAAGTAVEGACAELRSEFYRIAVKKGERLSVEVVAQRLGSPLDPFLRLLDVQGRELALNDDAPGLGADARIDFRSPATADYWIELRDTRHAGGIRHRYRLRVGEPLPAPLPFVSSPVVTKLTAPLHPVPPVAETEPNDGPARAQVIRLPAELSGRLDRPGDRDVFEFRVEIGARLIFTGQTRSLGSPCDLFLQLQATNGAKIAEANATGADEGLLTNRFNVAGAHRLVVEELNGNGGPACAYRIGIREWKPGFTLSTDIERVSAPAGDAVEIEVKAARRDYDGPIELFAQGLPEGFGATNAIIAAKTNSTRIRLSIPAALPMGDFNLFSITGSAAVEGAKVEERVSTMPALRSAFPDLRYPPPALDGLLTLGVSESKSSNPKPPQRKRRN